MRELVFKNITSNDKNRKVIVSSELVDNKGVRSAITRHFICLVKEVKDQSQMQRPVPYLYVLKERNSKDHREKFLCRIKGSVYAVNKDRLFHIVFMHSLRICVTSITEDLKI